MTKVIIIAAGTGSRLKPLTDNSPKAMLNVGNTTIIENQIKIYKSLGYKKYFKIKNKSNLTKKLRTFLNTKGPAFLEILIKNSSINNLMRPKNLLKIKKNFMRKF